MNGNAYPNAEFILLRDYIPAEHFRTVQKELHEDWLRGRAEIPVLIEFSRNSAIIPDCYTGMMYVYGYVHDNSNIQAVFTGELAGEYEKRRILLHDWEDRFLIVFESGDRTSEKAYFVTIEEVKNLMENCLHPNP